MSNLTIEECLAISANFPLHTEQDRITYGSKFVMLGGLDLPNPIEQFIVYGQVPDFHRVFISLVAQGRDPHNIVERLAMMVDLDQHDVIIGSAYSMHEPKGIPFHAPKALLWPIDEKVFADARSAGFEFNALEPGTKANLGIATAAYRTHKQVTGTGMLR